MFFNYPDEYSVPVSYSYDLANINEESDEINIEVEKEKNLLRNTDPFSEKVECKDNDLEKPECKETEGIFNEADEEYINNELQLDI